LLKIKQRPGFSRVAAFVLQSGFCKNRRSVPVSGAAANALADGHCSRYLPLTKQSAIAVFN